MTVGTRIGPRTVWTALSCGRIGRVIHSSQGTGRTFEAWSVANAECGVRNAESLGSGQGSISISRAVATLVAIMQKASWGVRMLIACQLRLRTSTVALFRTFIVTRVTLLHRYIVTSLHCYI